MAESSIKIVYGLCAGGRIVSSVPPSSSRAADVHFLSPEEYAAISDAHTVTSSFFDSNPASQIEKFGVMAHVCSRFESRSDLKTPKPMNRGIKSFELLNSANRWYFIQVYSPLGYRAVPCRFRYPLGFSPPPLVYRKLHGVPRFGAGIRVNRRFRRRRPQLCCHARRPRRGRSRRPHDLGPRRQDLRAWQ